MSKKRSSKKRPAVGTKSVKVLKTLPLINLKVEPAIKNAMQVRAKKHGLNLSAWIRFASTTFQPTKAQLQRRAA
jgi:hypothetical protein